MIIWLRGLVRSSDKLKTLYLYYQSVYGYQSCQNGNLPWWATACQATWSFGHTDLQNRVTNQNHYISTTRVQDSGLPGAASAHNVTRPFGHTVLQDHMTILNHYISSSTELIATKLDRMVTYLQWLLPRNSSTVWLDGLSKSRDKIKCYFPTITAPVATKHGRMLTDLPWETYSSKVI